MSTNAIIATKIIKMNMSVHMFIGMDIWMELVKCF